MVEILEKLTMSYDLDARDDQSTMNHYLTLVLFELNCLLVSFFIADISHDLF